MTTKSYAAILEGLDTALARCKSLGLGEQVLQSRFVIYRQWLEELISISVLSREGRVTDDDRAAMLQRREEYLAALADSDQMSEIAAHLDGLDPALLKRKLRDVLGGGPPLLREETANSNQSRNILFELLLAARLRGAGLQPQIGDRPDVTCEIGDHVFAFECKRLFSEKQLLGRIAEGAGALRQVIAAAPGATQGVVVVSVAKLFAPDHVSSPVHGGTVAREFLAAWLTELAGATRQGVNGWEQWIRDGAVVGIMFHVTGIFTNTAVGRFELGEQWLGTYFRETAGFLELGRRLTATAH